MPTRVYKPTTNGRRFMSVMDTSNLSKVKPEESLLVHRKVTAGRNSQGRVTARHRGGGHKRQYRIIDWRRDKDNVPARVATIEYDPNRTARIALLHYADGEKRYILAANNMQVGDTVISGVAQDIKIGNAMMLQNMPIGPIVRNVELKPGRGAQMARSAGSSAQLMAKEGKYALLRLPSSEVRKVPIVCRATVGQVGNVDHENMMIGKAGRSRWMGKRPHIRGVATNPCDHPHGGGEARSTCGRPSTTPWGKPTYGLKTRRKQPGDKMIVRRRTAK